MTRTGVFLFLAVSVVWGIPYLFIKIAVDEIDPTVVVCARAVIAAAVLLPLVMRRGLLRLTRAQWLALALFSLIHMVGSFVLVSTGEQHVSSSLTSLLLAANPLLVALLALGFMKSERINGPRLMGLLIGLLGLVVLLGFDVRGDGQQWLGVACLLLAALGYATSALLLRRPRLVELPRSGVAAAECAITTVVLLPFALPRLPSRAPSIGAIASLLVLGLVCTALALPLFFALIKEVGASRGAVVGYVNPLVAVLLGAVVLHEQITLGTIAGFLLIVLGSWLATTGTLPVPFTRRLSKLLASSRA
jgi:drug/metabolite transporter (DMT)-like permease